jgi:hypothetical protein
LQAAKQSGGIPSEPTADRKDIGGRLHHDMVATTRGWTDDASKSTPAESDDSLTALRRDVKSSKQETEPGHRLQVEQDKNILRSEDKSMNSYQAYLDLKCLLEFYRIYVKPRWDHFQNPPKDGLRVRFGDLCYLFRPGVDILRPEEPQKVFRVMKISGGRPRLSYLYTGDVNKAGRDESFDGKASEEARPENAQTATAKAPKASVNPTSSKHWTEFVIECYYLNYNGEHFGVVHCLIPILPFSGKKDVRQLRAYPLRLANEKMHSRQSYINTGRRFWERSKGGLCYYEGRTLLTSDDPAAILPWAAPSSTYVNSQVVVDFKKTFQVSASLQLHPLGRT